MSSMPDVAQTLAVVALFAKGSTTMGGLESLRLKETDRLSALTTELTRLGARVERDETSMTIHPPSQVAPAAINTYDDHRMAMSFAVAASRVGGIAVKNADCVNKTYPQFFDDLKRALGGA